MLLPLLPGTVVLASFTLVNSHDTSVIISGVFMSSVLGSWLNLRTYKPKWNKKSS